MMGTRGLYGFRKDGVNKLTYNHYDSYPSGLGKHILEVIRDFPNGRLIEYFNNIQLVTLGSKPIAKKIVL